MQINNGLGPEPQLKRFRIYGIIVFGVVMAALLWGFKVIPLEGLYLTAAIEIIILLVAVLGFLASGRTFDEVFPIKKPSARSLRGGLFVWLGAYCVTIGVTALQLSLFPEMFEASNAINQTIGREPLLVRIFVVVIMAGVCEEVLHRGVMLSSIDGIKSTALRVFIMAVCFGLFHTDPYRFMPTAILGAGLTYIVIKSGNLLLGMIFHGVNNFLPSILSGFTVGMDTTADISRFLSIYTPAVSSGVMLIYSSIGALLLYAGSRQLRPKESLPKRRLKVILPTACLMFLCGCGIMMSGITADMYEEPFAGYSAESSVFSVDMSYYENESKEVGESFEVKESGVFLLSAEARKIKASITVTNADGGAVFEKKDFDEKLLATIRLEKGSYSVKYCLNADIKPEDEQARFKMSIEKSL